jgi:hypothetical protein
MNTLYLKKRVSNNRNNWKSFGRSLENRRIPKKEESQDASSCSVGINPHVLRERRRGMQTLTLTLIAMGYL